jgi:hypothetical protein
MVVVMVMMDFLGHLWGANQDFLIVDGDADSADVAGSTASLSGIGLFIGPEGECSDRVIAPTETGDVNGLPGENDVTRAFDTRVFTVDDVDSIDGQDDIAATVAVIVNPDGVRTGRGGLNVCLIEIIDLSKNETVLNETDLHVIQYLGLRQTRIGPSLGTNEAGSARTTSRLCLRARRSSRMRAERCRDGSSSGSTMRASAYRLIQSVVSAFNRRVIGSKGCVLFCT